MLNITIKSVITIISVLTYIYLTIILFQSKYMMTVHLQLQNQNDGLEDNIDLLLNSNFRKLWIGF